MTAEQLEQYAAEITEGLKETLTGHFQQMGSRLAFPLSRIREITATPADSSTLRMYEAVEGQLMTINQLIANYPLLARDGTVSEMVKAAGNWMRAARFHWSEDAALYRRGLQNIEGAQS